MALITVLTALIFAQRAGSPVPADICPRPNPGGEVSAAADLRTSAGKLSLTLTLRNSLDSFGNQRYCYQDKGGLQSPTLRLMPGDELSLNLKNELRNLGNQPLGHTHMAKAVSGPCAGRAVTPVSTNLHFHGLNVPPVCHQDEVLHTLIQPSDPPFHYRIKIPADQPPGLYWYHPHPHGSSETQVLGGASGAIVIEGIERLAPEVAGLPERILVLRDQLQGEKWEGSGEKGEDPRDISINFIPIIYAHQLPASLRVRPETKEFWRVLNASAGTYFNLRLMYEHNQYGFMPENLRVIALDGSPVPAGIVDSRTEILLPPGGRAEFVVTTPRAGVVARLVTFWYEIGPAGLVHPERILASIVSAKDAPAAPSVIPQPKVSQNAQSAPATLAPDMRRKLYFSEDSPDPADPKKVPRYFLTVEGATPRQFDMNSKTADIVVKQGTVEDWEIENRAREGHTFHIHQLHFQVVERNGMPLRQVESRDTIDLPFWSGKGPYPSVKLRMDFRNPAIVGTFVFHCHILEHEDGGMMGSIEIKK